jgi:L-ascorbate metabolism protein UlaG (beta-lactamase superfamily)
MLSHFIIILLTIVFSTLTSGHVYAGNDMNKKAESNQVITPVRSGDKYKNWISTQMLADGNYLSATWDWIKGGKRTTPNGDIPVVVLNRKSFPETIHEGLTFSWLGHSSVLLEISGCRILIDPVFSKYASPIPLFVKRFSKPPITAGQFPKVDIVLITHDHYDHLDKNVVKILSRQGSYFLVPEGVGGHLRAWGIPKKKIEELTWWQQTRYNNLSLACVPARHFSGRGLFDRDKTLWAGWVIQSKSKSVYCSGDTGYADHFKAIGEAYGPFDLTIIKVGAYSEKWPEIHINPEEAVQAHIEVQGKLLLPVHWATFNLALHPWDEPIIRTIKAAKKNNVRLTIPFIGEIVNIENTAENKEWWTHIQ